MCWAGVCCRGGSKPAQQKVCLYTSVDQTLAEPIIAEFEKQTGIKVVARFDAEADKTVGLVQRLRSERARPYADVFWSNEVFYMIQLAREGLLEGYVSEETKDWRKRFADPQGRWHGFCLRARVIAYNTRRVTPEEAPKRLEDLLQEKWKDRIAMAKPQFGTTGGCVSSWFVHYGQQRAEQILSGLKANRIQVLPSNSQAVRAVADGRADVCLTDTDDVYAAQRNGWPVARNFLSLGEAGALAIPNTVALVKGGPNPTEARRLVAFLLSEQVEEMRVRSESHNTPVRASLAQRFPQYAIPKPLDVDYEKVADALSSAIPKAREILR
ncbi:MAG: hypothetical protein AMJ81_11425 [Phycisphaerae bacterium SM23_33]|nr:MAG: hypothetical protein AMJ81_11425 [Phycisphaerae bacterium SM23_33]